nr:LamG domain-containing protein [Treponema sp.]
MIQLKLEANNKYYYYEPLEKLIIPNGYQLNENLQHQEKQVSLRLAYDSELHKILIENQNIPAKLVDDDRILFTGTIDSGISWTDNGNPEPLECFNITIFDNSGKLQATTESEFAMINKPLTEIIVAICDKCGIVCSRTNFPVDDPIVPVFILPAEKEFYQPLSDLLFEYGYAFGFDNNGFFGLINLTQPQTATFNDDLYEGVKFSRTKKKYTGLSVIYGQLVQKNNEQVFFEGGDLDAENKILPIVIQPGAYYPWESDPIIEADEGQVFQQFAAGFAEEKTLYNGEKKYQRNNNSKLIYTTNHELVPDFSDNLTVDRKEFSFTQASIRFHNTSTTDATLKQLAIRATAYYRQEQQIILGSGKKFEYQTNYLYDKAKTDAFVEILKKYFLGGNFKITFKTDIEFTPGTKTKINTGLSGITADALILSCEKDFDNENYTVNAITIQDISLDEKKYQTQKSMTADQLIQRTEYTTTAIKTIQEEYYLSTSRTELIGGKWQITPPTPSTNTYIWTRTQFIYDDGTEVTTDPISVSGENGDNIESVDVEYAQNQSRTTAPTTGWQTTAPTAKDGFYIWSRTKIKLKDKDATYTDAVCVTGDKGADGKSVITMTSATTPNGEYNGQIGVWQGQLYSWNGTSWVLTSGILPTDPVLHYSFDDDINGYTPVEIVNSSLSADNNNGTVTLENKNNLLINFTKETLQMFQVAFVIDGLTTGANLSFEIETNNASYADVIYYTGGTYIRDGVLDLTQKHLVYKYNGNSPRIILQIYEGKTGQYCNLKNISFVQNKPIINNVDGKNNGVNNGGISVKGVNSNAIRLYKNSIVAANFTTPQNFSVSIWCKPENNTKDVEQNIVYSNSFIMRNGAPWGNFFMAYCFTQLEDGTYDDALLRSPAMRLLDPNKFTHIVLTKDKNILKLYIDGKLEDSQTRYSEIMRKTDVIYLGNTNNGKNQDLDDFQIFDRALSDQEVLGLYLARGNTPKQYTMADYQLDNSSGKYYGYEKPAVPFKNDTYLDTTTGYMYEYDGVKWVAIIDVSDSRYNQAINDMIAFAENNPDLPFITARNAWIKRLTVDGLLANEIATKMLMVRDKGLIKSENYNGTIDENGNIKAYGSAGWAIDHAGKSDFVNIRALNAQIMGSLESENFDPTSQTSGYKFYKDGNLARGIIPLLETYQINSTFKDKPVRFPKRGIASAVFTKLGIGMTRYRTWDAIIGNLGLVTGRTSTDGFILCNGVINGKNVHYLAIQNDPVASFISAYGYNGSTFNNIYEEFTYGKYPTAKVDIIF